MASALHAISTPYSTSVSVPLHAITARSIATPYSTSVSVPLYAITARSITNQRTSSGVGIGFTFLPHVIIPDKRHGVHWANLVPRLFPVLCSTRGKSLGTRLLLGLFHTNHQSRSPSPRSSGRNARLWDNPLPETRNHG